MESIGAFKTHLSELLFRVARGESVNITRHGRPVALLGPAEADRTRAREAVARTSERRRHIKGATLAELLKSVHEGHRY